MTPWEDRIINAFIERYPASAAARLANSKKNILRIPALKVFPGFYNAAPDERESFLDAAKSLETRKILSLVWVRYRKDAELSTLVCHDMEKLFEFSQKPSPKTIAEAAREAAGKIALHLRIEGDEDPNTEKTCAFFSFLSENMTAPDAAKGIGAESVHDLAKLFQAVSKPVNLTLRALSISLYNDSKKLEALINSCKAIFARAERQRIAMPELSFLDRSFPETSIAGRITITIENSQALVNESGSILTLPLVTIQKIESIADCHSESASGEHPSVLMLENKETFFTLAAALYTSGASCRTYTCILYVGGYPNRAVCALVRILAKSGFTFYHSGDLDPDGILILQELQGIINNAGIAGQTVTPVYMDTSTFARYLEHGRKLEPSMLQRITLIKDETRALPGIAELIEKIEKTRKGIEQEIIEYHL
ncbi:hypothetical protein AGMMS49587_12210 [Spirochaetia bacterium]|nr:hypothetical protein AGMMS49587_12210 [Spirochaetia bacterium]